jgi:AraC-like DNA-binding protein
MQLDVTSTKQRTILDFRKEGFHDLQILGKYNYDRAKKNLPKHRHPGTIEICYCAKGSAIFEVGDKKHLVKGGEVFIHYPNEAHSSGGQPEEKGTLYWMIVCLKKPSSNLIVLCNKLIDQNRRHFSAGVTLKQKLDCVFIAHATHEDAAIKKIRIKLLAEAFVLDLIDCGDGKKRIARNNRLDNAIAYISANPTEQITLSALADKVNLSESRFKGLFKEITGFTPGDFIQRKRIEKALEKLGSNPSVSITDLAYELNFSSPQYFSSVIRKYTGKSPAMLKGK